MVKRGKVQVVHPGLLDKFKLPLNIAVDANKVQSPLFPIILINVLGSVTVRAPSPDDAVAFHGK